MTSKNVNFLLLNTLFCTCLASLEDPRLAKILDYHSEHTGTGHYFFRFESSDGIVREEEGNVLDENSQDSPVIMKGSYSYTDETGKVYTVRYLADENGFHPEGEHIKVPSYVVNPAPSALYAASTARPEVPLRFIQTTTRPQFLPASPTRLPVNQFSTTARPEIASVTPSRIQIPVDTSTPGPNRGVRPIPFNELDGKLHGSIVNLLSNGDGRGFNIAAVNSL
ncbi:Chitin bind 4 domain containing protein [Asbolus verrucosus]|uniref:Chitin bind 4 domain containing protein n=1 Tax=Asbolus verrucosus TaxID=1661398 RepID=A0A482WCB6_ASBVE|nr:Chitin bind 4 domain containing protein [Asbolus verrucosus]